MSRIGTGQVTGIKRHKSKQNGDPGKPWIHKPLSGKGRTKIW